MYSFRGTPDKPALFNLERLREWNKVEGERGNHWIGWMLNSLNWMDRQERYFDIEWALEQMHGDGADWIAREEARELRAWADRLEKWADTHSERNE